MIDIEKVYEILCAVSKMSKEEAENYSVLVQNSAAVVEGSLKNPSFESDDRIIYLAAMRAYYNISLSASDAGNISEFSAGDVKISVNSSACDSALLLYREAAEAASEMVVDNGFVFRGV